VPRSPSLWRIKLHRSYSVEEAAKALTVHKNTVRRWIKDGLPTVGGRGQTLILGSELRAFLDAKRKRAKRPCSPGFMFCLRCRTPRPPAGRMLEYVPLSPRSGNLQALCPDCLTVMYRRIKRTNVARFEAAIGHHADAPITAPK
jgi:excisionase family DNA binding protein